MTIFSSWGTYFNVCLFFLTTRLIKVFIIIIIQTHKQELGIQALAEQQQADLGLDQPQEVTDAEVTIDTEVIDGHMDDGGGGEQIENDGGGVVMHEVHAQIEVAAELTQVFELQEFL